MQGAGGDKWFPGENQKGFNISKIIQWGNRTTAETFVWDLGSSWGYEAGRGPVGRSMRFALLMFRKYQFTVYWSTMFVHFARAAELRRLPRAK